MASSFLESMGIVLLKVLIRQLETFSFGVRLLQPLYPHYVVQILAVLISKMLNNVVLVLHRGVQ